MGVHERNRELTEQLETAHATIESLKKQIDRTVQEATAELRRENRRLADENNRLNDTLRAAVGGFAGDIEKQRDQYRRERDDLRESIARYYEDARAVHDNAQASLKKIVTSANEDAKNDSVSRVYGDIIQIAIYSLNQRIDNFTGTIMPVSDDPNNSTDLLTRARWYTLQSGYILQGEWIIRLAQIASTNDPRWICADIVQRAQRNGGDVPLTVVSRLTERWKRQYLDRTRPPRPDTLVDYIRIGYRIINRLPLADGDNYVIDRTKSTCKRYFEAIQSHALDILRPA